jgi:hypothetical protein
MTKDMVPEGLPLLGAEHGMPKMPDAEIALYRAPGTLSWAAQLLSEHIVHSLEPARPKRDNASRKHNHANDSTG